MLTCHLFSKGVSQWGIIDIPSWLSDCPDPNFVSRRWTTYYSLYNDLKVLSIKRNRTICKLECRSRQVGVINLYSTTRVTDHVSFTTLYNRHQNFDRSTYPRNSDVTERRVGQFLREKIERRCLVSIPSFDQGPSSDEVFLRISRHY